MNESKINKINKVLASYFEQNKSVKQIPALDLMDEFVAAGIFKSDSKRAGFPIRKILRELDADDKLGLIPYVVAERKPKKTYWYFAPLKKDNAHP